jgi:hypothetical protein
VARGHFGGVTAHEPPDRVGSSSSAQVVEVVCDDAHLARITASQSVAGSAVGHHLGTIGASHRVAQRGTEKLDAGDDIEPADGDLQLMSMTHRKRRSVNRWLELDRATNGAGKSTIT